MSVKKTSEMELESAFRTHILDFIISIFYAFDEEKHFKKDSKDGHIIFDFEQFVEDSDPEVRELLKIINETPVVW